MRIGPVMRNIWRRVGTKAYYLAGNVGIGTFNPDSIFVTISQQDLAVLGDELVTNGGFVTDTDWTKGAGWTIADGKATHAPGSTASLSQDITVVSGTKYICSYISVNRNAGTLTFKFNGQSPSFLVNGNGLHPTLPNAYTFTATSTGTVTIELVPTSVVDCDIDNVTVKAFEETSEPAMSLKNSDETVGVEIRSGGIGLGNVFIGHGVGESIISGESNVGIGYDTLQNNTTGYKNVTIGYEAMKSNLSGKNTVSIGFRNMKNAEGGAYSIVIGREAGYNLLSSKNVLLGYKSGYSISTGGQNILVGYYGAVPDNTASGQMNIGCIIWGTGNTAILTNVSTGKIGIGVKDPDSRLEVKSNNNDDSGYAFTVRNSDDTDLLRVRDDGNAGIGVSDPHSKLEVAGAISSDTMTVTASADNIDVSGVNIVFLNVTSNITIGGLTGGVAGQVLHIIYKGNYTNTVTIEDTEGIGDQDFYMHTRADETVDGGGWTFVCDGSNWHDCSHARHV